MVSLRMAEATDRDTILAFIEAMGFQPRDPTTWDSLAMTAATAWEGDTLVGAIPVEPRVLIASDGRPTNVLHETVVAVDPKFRSHGIGSALQTLLHRERPCGAELLTVYRELPESGAYRWYVANGFSHATSIISWLWDFKDADLTPSREDSADSAPLRERDRLPGCVDPDARPLEGWLAVHPYRRRYTFRTHGYHERAWALTGMGRMHTSTARLDILDLTDGGDFDTTRTLLTQLREHALSNGCGAMRLALASNDPRAAIAQELGASAGWPFDLLTRPLTPHATLGSDLRYRTLDYI
ncbi:MAG: hypothetical protein RLZZ383_845 [Pseudomonadota bacterium]